MTWRPFGPELKAEGLSTGSAESKDSGSRVPSAQISSISYPSGMIKPPGHCAGIHSIAGCTPHFRLTRCGHNILRSDLA